MNYSKNKKYFKPVKFVSGIVCGVIALICLVVFALGCFEGQFFIMALIFAAAALAAALDSFKIFGYPTDADIDAAVTSQLSDLKQRALNKLGLDEDEVKEVAPIVIHGYVYQNSLITQGKDMEYRSNKYQAIMFLFSSNEVHCYTYDFSLTDNSQRESTDVYFYKDIVSVSTQTESTDYSVGKNKSIKVDCEYFKLTTTGGTSISCTVRNPDETQRSINGMRALIKSKKMA